MMTTRAVALLAVTLFLVGSPSGGYAAQLSRSTPDVPTHPVLSVHDAGSFCAHHAGGHVTVSVRGALTAMPLQGPGGGFVGRLFAKPNVHAFFAGDTKPFVQIWGTRAWSLSLSGWRVTFHGALSCDAATYRERANLPGWLASMRPDRYTVVPSPSGVTPHGARIAPVALLARSAATNCAAFTLTPHPGINPPLSNQPQFPPPAPNIPPHGSAVALLLYPGATPLKPDAGSAYPEVSADQYLETASAEFESTSGVAAVKAWYRANLSACGWTGPGHWETNASVFTSGFARTSTTYPNVTLYVSFGSGPSGGAFIAYGVEQIVFPPRPAASYLRGPFVAVGIALQHIRFQRAGNGSEQMQTTVVHATLRDSAAIGRLVGAINGIREYRTVLPVCYGGLKTVGPAWLTFVRADGSVVHAYESGPGACNGLAVNGVRWLTDEGAVWDQITRLTAGRG